MVMATAQPFDLKPYIDVLYRHRLSALCIFLLGLATTLSLLLLLPDMYRSSELLVVQMPEVMTAEVESSGTTRESRGSGQTQPVMEQLEKLSQETYTDAALTALITEMHLYGQSASSRSAGSAVAYMRKHIDLTVPERSFNYENTQRKREERGANLLAISFEYTNPRIAQQVTHRLTNLLLAANVTERVKSAARAREFLERSVGQTEQKLLAMEKERERVKKRFAGSLPEQLPQNINELGRLEEEL